MYDGKPGVPLKSPVPLGKFGTAEGSSAGNQSRAVPLARLEAISRLNAFRCGTSVDEYAFQRPGDARPARPVRYGLFPLAALLNHSCVPNVSKVMHSEGKHEWIVLRAASALQKGDEARHYYW